MADVVEAARRNPGAVTFDSVRNGSTGHLQIRLWQEATGLKLPTRRTRARPRW
jgi:hypothetical protein